MTAATVGTVSQLHQVTCIPVSTINLFARQGALHLVDRVLVGRRWAARYDGQELLRVYATRMGKRRNVRAALDRDDRLAV
jgi:hypothetical protein